jgi:rare lipoprotein A (peptidoglycan hydrolase)
MADEDPSAVIDTPAESSDTPAQTPVAPPPAASTAPASSHPAKADWNSFTDASAGVGLAHEFDQKVVGWKAAVKDRLGLDIQITEGYRDPARSDQLRASGVVALPGGQSYHNYGQALDYGFQTDKGIDLKNEKAYTQAGEIAKEYGISTISNESGHLQNADYKSVKDIKAGQPWSQYTDAPPTASRSSSEGTTQQTTPQTSGSGGGWKSGVGSEFGEVDNPAHGGYTEPNWNKGAGGASLEGWNTEGVALPNVPLGTRVALRNDATGVTTVTTVKDRGPGQGTGADIDMLAGTRSNLGFPQNYKGPVSYRVLGPGETGSSAATGGSSAATGGSSAAPGGQGWDKFTDAPADVAKALAPQTDQKAKSVDRDKIVARGVPIAQSVDPKTIVKPAALADLSPSSGAESYGASAAISGIGSGLERAQPVGAEAEGYGASAGMSRGTTYDSSPPATSRDLNLRDPNNPWQLQINEIQGNPQLSASQKDWMVKSLQAQQAKANPEPNVQRALPVGQFADNAPVDVQPAKSVEGGYAGTNLPTGATAATKPQSRPDDAITTLNKSVQNFYQSAIETLHQQGKGEAESEVLQPSVNNPYDRQIEETKVNPDLNENQKTQMILALTQKKAEALAYSVGDIAKEQKGVEQAQKARPDEAFQKTLPGQISSTAGGLVPVLAASVTGPMAPFVVATQMTASKFDETLTRGIEDSKKTHPEWTDTERITNATQAASDSARAAG